MRTARDEGEVSDIVDLDLLVAVGQLANGQTRMERALADIKQAMRQKEVAPPAEPAAPAAPEIIDVDMLVEVNKLALGQSRVEELLAGIQRDLASLPERLGDSRTRQSPPSSSRFQSIRGEQLRPSVSQSLLPSAASQSLHPSASQSISFELRSSSASNVDFFMPGMDDGSFSESPNRNSMSGSRGSVFLDNWPESVQLRQGYHASRGTLLLRGKAASCCDSAKARSNSRNSIKSKEKAPGRCQAPSWLAVHPTSTFRSLWNLVSVLMLLHDMTVVPVILAWNLSTVGWMLGIAWASCLFWTIDVFLSFITGYTKSGRLEMDVSRIARRYITSWFLPEVLIVTNDWLNLLMSVVSLSGSLRILRFTKALKLLRVIGALRVMKISRMVKESLECHLAGFTVIVQCIMASCCALWLSHILGCIWFGVGRLAPTDTKVRWTDMTQEHEGLVIPFMEETLMYQYVTAVHWAFAQFTLGAMEIACTNSIERIFNILCLLIGLTFGSMIVSSLSASMVDYQMRILDKTDKMRRLTRFLRENRICHNTTLQVQQQAVERLNMEDRLKEEDVQVLELLSKPLRLELRHEIYGSFLHTHPLLNLWTKMDYDFVQRVCMQAADFVFPRQHDEVFVAGTYTDKAYYIISGTLEYHQDTDFLPIIESKTTTVSDGSWLAEAALWSHWMHVGTCKAVTGSHILTLNAEEILKLCHRRGFVREVASDYSRIFHRRILAAKPPHSYPSDIAVPETEFSDLLMDMDVQVRTRIGMVALEHLRQKDFFKFRRQEDMDQLADEVARGRSFLYVDVTGTVERVVHKVEARIVRADGRMFVRVAKSLDGKRVDASCKLPRCKTEQGETPEEAYERLLASLGWSFTDISDSTSEEETVVKESRKFKLHTKYLVTATSCVVTSEVHLPTVAMGGPKACSIRSERSSGLNAERLARTSRSSGFLRAEALARSRRSTSSVYIPEEMSSSSRFYKAQQADFPERLCFYTWIPVGKLNYWSSSNGKKDLNDWLSSVRLAL